jgi:hypothetical protein
MQPVIEVLQPPMVEARDLATWYPGPCSESAGDGIFGWWGKLVVD